MAAVPTNTTDVVVCEYDLLATFPLEVWERDDLLRQTPIVAVSLTRRPNEMHLLDVNSIAGFLYLPTLRADDARRILYGAATRSSQVEADSPLFSTPSDAPGAP
jgi:hypothetical protein